MKITLRIPTGEVGENGPVLEEKTFHQVFISGMAFRKTIAMKKTLAAAETGEEEKIDLMVDYIVDLFGKQFTRDDYYNGIEADEVISTITGCLETVVNRATKAIGAKPDPNEK